MARKKVRQPPTLVVYPQHAFDDPQDILVFIELDGFWDDWKHLGLNDEEDMSTLQIAIMLEPKGSPVIPGTEGLRKMYFSPPGYPRGKRNAHRICYTYFAELGIVLLCAAYAKNEKDDLSANAKKIISKEILRQHQLLSNGFYK